MESNTVKRSSLGGTNFLISIYHHENNSWQGSLQWLDTGKKIHFRSELELLNLMQQAIKTGNGHNDMRTWDDDKIKNVG
ncbi:MAG: hypothetical protein JXQ26_06420 [Tissierellales bacterium]|nr:hypothetical protein [Tissierellales bacterium]MBN2827603.1 hypothetical protein [Tissierellales bacterium]